MTPPAKPGAALATEAGTEKECPDCNHTRGRCGEDCVCNCDAARAEHEASTLRARLAAVTVQKDGAYRERDRLVALVAHMARGFGWNAGLGRHVDKLGEPPWEDDWRNIVFIDMPAGQVSWHVHDSEMHLFEGLPPYPDPWDGHTTAEKYDRVDIAIGSFQP